LEKLPEKTSTENERQAGWGGRRTRTRKIKGFHDRLKQGGGDPTLRKKTAQKITKKRKGRSPTAMATRLESPAETSRLHWSRRGSSKKREAEAPQAALLISSNSLGRKKRNLKTS